MKIKRAIIGTVLAATIAAGSVYGAWQYSVSHRSPVNVMPVSTANLASWFYDDSDTEGDTLDGTVFSKGTQTVELSNEYALTNVYVKEGDTVKVGDALMEYDMTLPELKLEMEEINKQSLEITLQKQEKQLEKIKANPNSASVVSEEDEDYADDGDYGDEGDDLTGSAEDPLIEGAGETVVITQEAQEEPAVDDEGGDEEPVISDGDGDSDDNSESDDASGDVSSLESENETKTDESNSGLVETESDSNGDLIDGLDIADDSNYMLNNLLEFRTAVNLLRIAYDADPSNIDADEITRALNIYQTSIGYNVDSTIIEPDVFGNRREVYQYKLNEEVLDFIEQQFSASGTATEQRIELLKAYVSARFYQLVARMNVIEKAMADEGITDNDITSVQLQNIRTQITDAATAYYQFVVEWERIRPALENALVAENQYSQEAAKEYYDNYYNMYYGAKIQEYIGLDGEITNSLTGTLAILAAKLNNIDTIEPETQPETEDIASTEMDLSNFEGADYDTDYDTASMTQEEIKQLIREQELAISETNLQIREQDIKIRQYERQLENKVVEATINGVVQSAGTLENGGSNESFIVVTGEEGLYVTFNVNELKRDTMKVGDVITGTSYENDAYFDGVITDISEYPSEDSDSGFSWYFGSDSDNTNASFYPVTAYIEDPGDLEEGSASVQVMSDGSGSGGTIYLENYFVRTEDSTGRAYVYIESDEGTLKKQYVKTGGSLWGTGIEIKAGLSTDDYIAFPYGKNVVEGARTVQVESVEEEY